MTEISVIAERVGTVHNVPIQLGMDYFDAKFDTGSSATVIAASVFFEGWSEKAINMLETLCSQKGCKLKEFKSASGHRIKGYPVIARDVSIGEIVFPIFRYYLIIDGRHEMSLLGDDFIDNCRYSHEPHGDIKITAFDFDNYGWNREGALDSDELMSLIDGLVDESS